jgi:hypothetical protein
MGEAKGGVMQLFVCDDFRSFLHLEGGEHVVGTRQVEGRGDGGARQVKAGMRGRVDDISLYYSSLRL